MTYGMLLLMSQDAFAPVFQADRAHPDTSTIFVMGLLGVVGGLIFGPLAWYFGNRLLAKYDAEPGRWGRRQWAKTGVILGKIGTFLIPVYVILLALA